MIEGLGNIYKVKGSYQFGGKENHFTGQFSIDSSGRITGKIWDPNSICSEHEVKGEIKQGQDNSAVILEFVKIPTGILADIYYQLQKVSDPKNKLAGAYDGVWSFKEEILPIPIVKGTLGETENQTHIDLEWLLPLI